MIFYNPLFPPFLPPEPNLKLSSDSASDEPDFVDKKISKKSSFLDVFRNFSNEQDTLIILALLLFLYKQDLYKSPLAVVLLLLLFDE